MSDQTTQYTRKQLNRLGAAKLQQLLVTLDVEQKIDMSDPGFNHKQWLVDQIYSIAGTEEKIGREKPNFRREVEEDELDEEIEIALDDDGDTEADAQVLFDDEAIFEDEDEDEDEKPVQAKPARRTRAPRTPVAKKINSVEIDSDDDSDDDDDKPRAGRRFSEDDVREMRRLRDEEHLSYAKIAEQFECSGVFVRNVVTRKLYKDIE